MSHKKVVLIGGMGEGLGSALAHYFSAKNYQVIGLNRSPNSHVGKEVIQLKVDLSDQGQVRQALEEINITHCVPDVFIHNAAELVIAPFEQTTVEQFEQCWRAGTLSAFVLSKELLPMMAEKGGTAIFTGATASIRGGDAFSAFSSAKFALRGLVQSLARQYQSSGLHVAHVLIDGIIDTEKSRKLLSLPVENMLNPLDIAECYWQLSQQPKSSWTHELDLRPYLEKF
ncbi:MAG: NAD(P)-dependent dehydrogenase (short-subunit alcohol dehydrogenase family) [Desulforhopalus sp.]|jgi:NAD(P)-dependent dehydrogenase (short-subunit alcohol dehydrogenase family)